MPQENESFPGLDVQKCYQLLEELGDASKTTTLVQFEALKEEFWRILDSELRKIDRGFIEREEVCCKRFQTFDFRTFIISQHNNMSVCRLFQEALREVYAQFEPVQISKVVSHPLKTEKNNDNLVYYAQYHQFCTLLRDIHSLRDFTMQTYDILMMMIKNLKQIVQQNQRLFGARTEAEIQGVDVRFRNVCNLPLYNSHVLSKLATRAEVIATSLLCAQSACPPQPTAFVCFHCQLLNKEIYVLRCFHRFCKSCIHGLHMNGNFDCPFCGRHDALRNLEKDEPLLSFIQTHFDAELFTNESNHHHAALMQPPPTAVANQNGGAVVIPIKPEPKDQALIPDHGMQYYNAAMPAYMIPNAHLKQENEGTPQPPLKRGRGRPKGSGRGRGRPKGSKNGAGRGSGSGEDVSDSKASVRGGRPRTPAANSLHAARTKIKNGGRAKTSCHQCKNNKDPSELLFCKNVKWGPGKKKGNMVLKHCRKKFCAQCMGKYETIERVDELFRLQEDSGLTEWQCPACADTCECAACWRRRHPNAGSGPPRPSSGNEAGDSQSDAEDPQSSHSSHSQIAATEPQQQQQPPQQQQQPPPMPVQPQPPTQQISHSSFSVTQPAGLPPLPAMNMMPPLPNMNNSNNDPNSIGFIMTNMPQTYN